MIIGDRLRILREQKQFSQAEIENRTGLLRCYISRIENGHTTPGVDTLEKLARALEVPLYQLFYEDDEPPKLPNVLRKRSGETPTWGENGKDARTLARFRRLLGCAREKDRQLLLHMAKKMAKTNAP